MRVSTIDALLSDSRLSDQARVIALWLLRQPADEEGFVAASYSELRPILHGIPSTETVGRHVRMLEGCGWIERQPGGRGNSDRFRLDPPQNPPLNIDPPQNRGLIEIRPPLEPGSNSLSPPLEPGSKAPVGGDSRGGKQLEEAVAVAGEEKNAGAPGATDVPKHELSDRAATVLTERGDDLNGCRGALRDYLRARVPTDRQYGYVQTVATWIDGGDWSVFKLPDGSRAPPAQIPKLLGAALNELLAADESMMKRPMGDPGNLKTKLSILCKQRGDHARNDSDTRTPSSGKRESAGLKHDPIRGDPSRRRRGKR